MIGLDYYWRKDSFDLLRRVTDLISNAPDADLYSEYLDYLRLKQQGLREQALAAADRFADRYMHESFEVRHHICWSMIERTESYWESWPTPTDWLFPHGLEAKLLGPTFKDWRLREPDNVNAWLYNTASGVEWGAKKAFELEPHNSRCQFVELGRLKSWIAFSVHELDHIGYVLDAPKEFSGAVNALMAVAQAIGKNLSDEVRSTLDWLQALAVVHNEIGGDLRPELAKRGIVKPDNSFLPTRLWFQAPPLVGVG